MITIPGGGLAMDETTLGLPLTVVDYQNLKPHISYLLNLYGINYVSRNVINLFLYICILKYLYRLPCGLDIQ